MEAFFQEHPYFHHKRCQITKFFPEKLLGNHSELQNKIRCSVLGSFFFATDSSLINNVYNEVKGTVLCMNLMKTSSQLTECVITVKISVCIKKKRNVRQSSVR